MGGNLLKTWSLPEKRISNNEYIFLKTEILNKFRSDYKLYRPVGLHARVAPSLRKKEDHGDLDIIIGSYMPHERETWKGEIDFGKYLTKEFGYSPVKNSNVYSFPYKGFQIDVTFYPVYEFESAINYCAWGDTSNLMGRIFHKMGLHYGHSGLSFWIRQGLFTKQCDWSDNDHIYEKFVLTKDIARICDIGGFDYSTWEAGFDTEEDAFKFIINSKYFSSELFQLENLNHINRVRNRKRGMYMRFIEYLESQKDLPKYEYLSKDNYSLIFQSQNPFLRTVIDKYRYENSIRETIKTKINGSLIKELFPEIEGPVIGNILSAIKKDYSDLDILQFTKNQCLDIIKQYKQKQTHTHT